MITEKLNEIAEELLRDGIEIKEIHATFTTHHDKYISDKTEVSNIDLKVNLQ